MTEELMVGTIGWDHDDWVGGFYPDDLPDDWRFAYYSNDYRAALATADHVRPESMAQIADWAEDCDDAFRFVIEIPRSLVAGAHTESLNNFVNTLAPLASRIGGFLLSVGDVGEDGTHSLKSKIELLQPHGPLCLDLPGEAAMPTSLLDVMQEYNIGLCWHPDRDSAPRPGGALSLALSSENDAKGQRQLIESMEQWMQQSNGLAGLFLESPEAASQARIVAEMLGI